MSEGFPFRDNNSPVRKIIHVCRWLLAGLVFCGLANKASADVITISGVINQATRDGTGPALNNTGLNKILDGKGYTVTLIATGSISSLQTHDLTGARLTFSVPSAPAIEASFHAIHLTISADGPYYDFSLLGCLTTGGSCEAGNQMDMNFKILATGVTSQNITAIELDSPHPFDLLEDDGITDINGSIASYSYLHLNPSALLYEYDFYAPGTNTVAATFLFPGIVRDFSPASYPIPGFTGFISPSPASLNPCDLTSNSSGELDCRLPGPFGGIFYFVFNYGGFPRQLGTFTGSGFASPNAVAPGTGYVPLQNGQIIQVLP